MTGTMTVQNKELSSIFHNIASIYKFLGGDNSFRAIAYQKASQALIGLPEDISYYIRENTLEDIPGIGTSLAHDIVEFSDKGAVRRFEQLKKRVPIGLIPLMDISGFGPESLKKLYKKLHLKTRDDVIAALQDGRVAELKGFGPKKIENMLRGLKLHKQTEERMLLWDALHVGERLIALLKEQPFIRRVALAGSLRRRMETIGDLDILAVVNPGDRKEAAEYFTTSELAREVLAKGDTRASIIMKENGKQADLRMVDESEWGSSLQYFTGSRQHNIHLRTIAKERGYKINEYGIFSIHKNKRIAGKTEAEIYEALGMQYIPPEMREDKGEIDLALSGKIPILIDLKDIKGDLQMHSTWSDGLMTLEEMADFVLKNFAYEYIAVTDHSKSERVAGGMDERQFLKQIREIKALNKKIGRDFIKAGVEVDILRDGSLDLPDHVLSQMDWVTASIHSGFGHNNTRRLIRACENPYVHCVGHPTGRILGRREAYALDVGDLIHAAAETHTALEINAQPDRMDMNDEFAASARKSGVMIVISTDSHKFSDFYCMQLGIDIARRAWCTADNVVNTRPWKEVEKLLGRKRK